MSLLLNNLLLVEKQFALKCKIDGILCLGKASLYNIGGGGGGVLALSLHSVKNELFSDSYRTLKNNTVRIAVSEDFNQNLKYN